MTLPLPSTTSFGASYIPFTIADLAMTANSDKLSSYHALTRSSFVCPDSVVVGVEVEAEEEEEEEA
jgi:hypothetical protein